jgi:hypothetical protein
MGSSSDEFLLELGYLDRFFLQSRFLDSLESETPAPCWDRFSAGQRGSIQRVFYEEIPLAEARFPLDIAGLELVERNFEVPLR